MRLAERTFQGVASYNIKLVAKKMIVVGSVLTLIGLSSCVAKNLFHERVTMIAVDSGELSTLEAYVKKHGEGSLEKLSFVITEEGLRFKTAFGFTSQETLDAWLKISHPYLFELREERRKRRAPHSSGGKSKMRQIADQRERGHTLYLYKKCTHPSAKLQVDDGEIISDLSDPEYNFDNVTKAVKHNGSSHELYDDYNHNGEPFIMLIGDVAHSCLPNRWKKITSSVYGW